jgi:hypothetical protein
MEQFKEAPELSEKELEQVIFLSYMFSQGLVTLQASFIHAITKMVGHQDEQLTKKAFDKFAESLKYSKDEGITLSRLYTHSRQVDDPKLHFDDISHISSELTVREDFDMQEMVDDLWQRDHLFLCERNGRPNRREVDFKPDTIQDPYFSFGVTYLLNDTATPSPVFNKLLEQLRQYDVSEYVKPEKEAVIDVYKKTHPDQTKYNL